MKKVHKKKKDGLKRKGGGGLISFLVFSSCCTLCINDLWNEECGQVVFRAIHGEPAIKMVSIGREDETLKTALECAQITYPPLFYKVTNVWHIWKPM